MLSPVRFWKSNKVVSFFSRGFLSLSFIFEFLIQPPSFLLTWQKFQVGCITTAVVKLVQNQAHLFRSFPRFFKIPRCPPRVSHFIFYSNDSNGCHAPCMTFPRIFKLLLKCYLVVVLLYTAFFPYDKHYLVYKKMQTINIFSFFKAERGGGGEGVAIMMPAVCFRKIVPTKYLILSLWYED